MIEIIPAILTNSFDELEKAVRLIEPHSARAHLDIADGVFVSSETISGHSELELISTGLRFDIHLMVTNPIIHINQWSRESADRFIVHIESSDVLTAIEELRNRGKGVGLALNPDTPIGRIEPFIDSVDFIQFMTIDPGFQGRDFLDHAVEKIRNFHKEYPEAVIVVDGGINPTTAKKAIDAGATILVSGSFILKSGNVGKAIDQLKSIG